MTNKWIWLTIGSALIIFGCSASKLTVETTPEGAEVFSLEKGRPPLSLGKSPLVIDLLKQQIQVKNLHLLISKEDHYSQSFIMPSSSWPKENRVFFNLEAIPQEEPPPEVDEKDNTKETMRRIEEMSKAERLKYEEQLKQIAKGIARVQFMTFRKDFMGAETELNRLVTQFPNVSTIYDLLGNIYYVQKNFTKALWAYRESNKIDPNNFETLQLIERIERIRGAETP